MVTRQFYWVLTALRHYFTTQTEGNSITAQRNLFSAFINFLSKVQKNRLRSLPPTTSRRNLVSEQRSQSHSSHSALSLVTRAGLSHISRAHLFHFKISKNIVIALAQEIPPTLKLQDYGQREDFTKSVQNPFKMCLKKLEGVVRTSVRWLSSRNSNRPKQPKLESEEPKRRMLLELLRSKGRKALYSIVQRMSQTAQ